MNVKRIKDYKKMSLPAYQIVVMFLTLVTITAFTILGLKIALKYLDYKNKNFLLIGIFWISVGTIWYSSFISSFLILTDISPNGLALEWYVFISSFFIGFTINFFVYAITDMVAKKYKKRILICSLIYSIIFEIILLYAIFTDISLLEIKSETDPLDLYYSDLYSIMSYILMVEFVSLGLLFGFQSIKTEIIEIKLKSKFIIASFFLFILASILEIVNNIYINAGARLISSLVALLFYWGYIMPDRVKKLFLKNKN